MIFSNRVFDCLKWCVLVLIPALTTAYVGFCQVFGWPYADEVSKSSAIVCAMLGTLLGISNLNYKLDKRDGDGE